MSARSGILTAVVAALLAACTESVAPDVDYVDVAVTLSRSEIVVGDTTEVRVVARNPTRRVLTFHTNACILGVRLRDVSGDVVFQDPVACNDILLTHALSPGESIEQTFHFDGTSTWGALPEGISARIALPPGIYQLIGGISADILSASQPVDLRIRPGPPQGAPGATAVHSISTLASPSPAAATATRLGGVGKYSA